MATPFEVIEQLAWGGLNADEVDAILNSLRTGQQDPRLTGNAAGIMQYIWEAGLDAGGVDQAIRYLSSGVMPEDVQQVRSEAPTPDTIPVSAAPAASIAGPAAPTGPSSEQKSARAIIQSALDEWNLGSLGDTLWQSYLGGTPMEQIFVDLRKTPEWKAQYGVIDKLAAKGQAINEAQVIALRRGYTQQLRAVGAPEGFYDSNDDFDDLIEKQVSASEFSDRLALAKVYAAEVASSADSGLVGQLQRMYGITPDSGAFLAIAIDPDRALPVLQTQFEAGKLGAAAMRSGFGQISSTTAEGLALQGVSDQQAQQGFGQLAQAQELFNPLDAGEDVIDRETQIAATFSNNAAAQERIRRRDARRKAQFESGGTYAGTQGQVSGLGSASS